jgi:outer membrane protein OmpA-like peptidoglycan-associated protein
MIRTFSNHLKTKVFPWLPGLPHESRRSHLQSQVLQSADLEGGWLSGPEYFGRLRMRIQSQAMGKPAFFIGLLFLCACGGAPATPQAPGEGTTSGADPTLPETTQPEAKGADESGESSEFKLNESTTAEGAHGARPSKLKPSKTHAVMKFFVVDKSENKPIPGIVISMKAPDGKKFFTEETDEAGYGEVLVPIGKKYEIVYLSLGRKDVSANVNVPNEPRQNIKLTLRYKPRKPVATGEPGTPKKPEVFRLDGVNFKSGSAAILPESFARLDEVIEYMTHKKSARIRISGHTDNVGKPAKNKALSQKRAEACLNYIAENGIDKSRIEAIGYGDEKPVASNKTQEGREQNRRIEVEEIVE